MKRHMILKILCVLAVLTMLSCATVEEVVKKDIVIEKVIKARGKSAEQIFGVIELWLSVKNNQTGQVQDMEVKYSNKTSNRVLVNMDERMGKTREYQGLFVHSKIAMEAQDGKLKMRLTFLGTSKKNSEDSSTDESVQEYSKAYPRGYGVRRQKIIRKSRKLIAEIRRAIRLI